MPKRRPRPTKESETNHELQMFREIVHALDDVLWVRDLKEERLIYASPAFERLWGQPASSVLASPRVWLNSIHPEDREEMRSAALGEARERVTTREYRILRP